VRKYQAETTRESGSESGSYPRNSQWSNLNAGTAVSFLHKSLHTPASRPVSIGLMLHKCRYKSQAVNVSQLFRPLPLLVTFLPVCVLNKHVEGKTIQAHCQGIGEIYHKQFWNDFPFPLCNVCLYVCITLCKASVTTTITTMTVAFKSPVGYIPAFKTVTTKAAPKQTRINWFIFIR
jgi:hypothetical protein